MRFNACKVMSLNAPSRAGGRHTDSPTHHSAASRRAFVRAGPRMPGGMTLLRAPRSDMLLAAPCLTPGASTQVLGGVVSRSVGTMPSSWPARLFSCPLHLFAVGSRPPAALSFCVPSCDIGHPADSA